MGTGYKLDEVAISGVVLGKQRQVIRGAIGCGATRVTARGQVYFTAKDGVDSSLSACGIKIYDPVHHSMIRDAQGIHPELLTPLHHGSDTTQPVQEAVLRVNVQMGEQGFPLVLLTSL